MKSFKSFKQISEGNINLESIFIDKTEYLAHTHKDKKNETLYEHIVKVTEYFNILVDINNLEKIINELILRISFDNNVIGEYLKTMFLHSIIFHDFGKINDNFQIERMKNPLFQADKSVKIGYEHSFLSAYIFLNYHFDNINKQNYKQEDKSILWAYTFLFSIPMLKHHSGYLEKDYDFEEQKTNSIHKFLAKIGFEFSIEFPKNFIKNENRLWEYFNKVIENKMFDFFPLFALLKLNYSLLTASDYYATSEYMSDMKFKTEEDFGLLTKNLKGKILNYFENNDKAKYNGELIRNTKKYLSTNIDDYRDKSNPNLNFLRQKLGAEVLANIEKHKDERIFYIEAPTGGGKTNMSMVAIYKMLQLHNEINKVFYVFPFTTLITQTAKAIKETLGLTEQEVTQVHSKAGFQTKETGGNEQDAKYGNEKRNQIDNLFINYPLTLLTHIKFFDILKSNKKDTNYILHRLANSIVIIDELQAYSPEHWDKIKFYISQYAKLFNIRFIIMSATLPKIDKIKMVYDTHFEPLINDAKAYLTNPNFADRVSIKTDLLDKKKIELTELADILLEKSKNYAKSRTDEYPNSIYTIIEFIFKKSASEFYDIISKLEEENKFFDEIFVLSGTIIEPRRKYIIEYLKDEENKKKKILLITTQVVEAGVDIDMDLGFKNQSLIDSDEQLAGRINRNVNKFNCELWLFRRDTPKSIYGKDLRYEVTEKFKPDFIKKILTNKIFNVLYERVFEEIDKLNLSGWKTNFQNYTSNFENLNFRKINDDFKLINSENATIFVPENIDIHCYGTGNKTENNFSVKELQFIKINKCLHNEKQVSGDKIWDLYVSLIQDNKLNFSKKRIKLKILNGIMSKFVFSIFMKKIKDLEKYCKFNDETGDYNNYQYFKFEKKYIGEGEIYDIYSGINEKLLEKELKQTFEII